MHPSVIGKGPFGAKLWNMFSVATEPLEKTSEYWKRMTSNFLGICVPDGLLVVD